MDKYLFAILRNEIEDDHQPWITACRQFNNVEYEIIDLTRNDWLEKVSDKNYDMFLCKPPGLSSRFKQLYDERVYILSVHLKKPVYPTLDEILIYENKRFQSYWLKANRLPHPVTQVFYWKDEAQNFVVNAQYPIVAKFNIGASGSGVKILRSDEEAAAYVNSAFSSKGAPKRWGPNLEKGGLIKRGLHYFLYPGDIRKKINLYKAKMNEVQTGFAIFQEYIPHDYEWRVVAIGDSYFAHKKLKAGEKASGSLLKNYDNPPLKLLDFAREIMQRFGFYSLALDIFETTEGNFLINEMQCIFGQSDPFQMLVNGKPGKYFHLKNNWHFEEGMFNTNASYDLRLEHVIKLINRKDESSVR